MTTQRIFARLAAGIASALLASACNALPEAGTERGAASQRPFDSSPAHDPSEASAQANPSTSSTASEHPEVANVPQEPSSISRSGNPSPGVSPRSIAVPPLGEWEREYKVSGTIEGPDGRHPAPSRAALHWLRRPDKAELFAEGRLRDGRDYHVAFALDFVDDSARGLEAIWTSVPTGRGTSVSQGFLFGRAIDMFALADSQQVTVEASSGNDRYGVTIARDSRTEWRLAIADQEETVLSLDLATSDAVPPWDWLHLLFRYEQAGTFVGDLLLETAS